MFLLDDILLAPIKGVMWLGEQVRKVALEQMYDEASLKKSLTELEDRWQKGEISDEEFSTKEKAILTALEIAKELQKEKK